MTELAAPYTVKVSQPPDGYQFVIPDKMIAKITRRSRLTARMKIDALLVWREYADEIAQGAIGIEQKRMARAMMISRETFRRLLWQTDRFMPDDLYRWIDNGVSFEHFERAILLESDSKRPPRQLLNEAIERGNEHGETMTVDEMTAYALGEQQPRPKTYAAMTWLSKLIDLPAKFGWDAEKREKFNYHFNAIKEMLA
jgi:hypothetical protein